MEAPLAKIGQDAVGDMPQDTSSHLDYVKIQIRTNDSGGLQHNDTYRCFLAIEMIVNGLIAIFITNYLAHHLFFLPTCLTTSCMSQNSIENYAFNFHFEMYCKGN